MTSELKEALAKLNSPKPPFWLAFRKHAPSQESGRLGALLLLRGRSWEANAKAIKSRVNPCGVPLRDGRNGLDSLAGVNRNRCSQSSGLSGE